MPSIKSFQRSHEVTISAEDAFANYACSNYMRSLVYMHGLHNLDQIVNRRKLHVHAHFSNAWRQIFSQRGSAFAMAIMCILNDSKIIDSFRIVKIKKHGDLLTNMFYCTI